VKVLHTIELEPGTAGITIHFRFAAPKTRREKALTKGIGPAYGQALQSGLPGLIAQLDAALPLVRRTAVPIPSWPGPGRTAPCPGFSRW